MKKTTDSGMVYSTGAGRICPGCEQPVGSCLCDNSPILTESDGVIRISRESKGRGGKQVTIINGIVKSSAELKELARMLKMKCGSGGSIKDGEIILQGDKREAAKSYLESEGYRVKLSGG
ncbi:stress response translation initiation inhibitor YciH [bacterium]|nr:stress response translation initiation inhibitor YciH [bacterium]